MDHFLLHTRNGIESRPNAFAKTDGFEFGLGHWNEDRCPIPSKLTLRRAKALRHFEWRAPSGHLLGFMGQRPIRINYPGQRSYTLTLQS